MGTDIKLQKQMKIHSTFRRMQEERKIQIIFSSLYNYITTNPLIGVLSTEIH